MILHQRHSQAFCSRWREIVAAEFRWRSQGEFLVVPSVTGGRTLSYLPLLNHTDADTAKRQELERAAGDRPRLIRTLEPEAPLMEGRPVAMRVPIEGESTESLWSGIIAPVCRNRVRRAERAGITVERGADDAMAGRFARLLADTLARHGAPLPPPGLFRRLTAGMEAEIILAGAGSQDLAGAMLVRDGNLLWVPWIANDRRAAAEAPGDLMFWTILRDAALSGVAVVDFGRSPMGGGTFQFKRKWGARPVAIGLHGAGGNPYSRFALAQSVWRRLPRPLVDRLGPCLVRYLADY